RGMDRNRAIELADDMAAASPLAQRRGSKLLEPGAISGRGRVASRAEAWIETDPAVGKSSEQGSPLAQRRGSKPQLVAQRAQEPASPLAQRRGSKPEAPGGHR